MLKKLNLNYKYKNFKQFFSCILVLIFLLSVVYFFTSNIKVFAEIKTFENSQLTIDLNLKKNLLGLKFFQTSKFITKNTNLESLFFQKYNSFIDLTSQNISTKNFNVNLVEQQNLKTNLEVNFGLENEKDYIEENLKIDSELFIKIPTIDLQSTKIGEGSIENIPKINQKLLQNPVMENQLSQKICSKKGNSYLMGHSEPSQNSEKNFKASFIFANLENLNLGEEIIFENQNQEVICKYKLIKIDSLTTNLDNKVTQEELDFALNPTNLPKNILTIQTCQKGSPTVRLLFRAELID